MTAQFPGTQRADLQVVRDDEQAADTTTKALGLLENARKVADSTVAEARAEAERLLAAARERAAQVQRDAKELGQKMRTDAERLRGDRPTVLVSLREQPDAGPIVEWVTALVRARRS